MLFSYKPYLVFKDKLYNIIEQSIAIFKTIEKYLPTWLRSPKHFRKCPTTSNISAVDAESSLSGKTKRKLSVVQIATAVTQRVIIETFVHRLNPTGNQALLIVYKGRGVVTSRVLISHHDNQT